MGLMGYTRCQPQMVCVCVSVKAGERREVREHGKHCLSLVSVRMINGSYRIKASREHGKRIRDVLEN